jgi:hypothetical protein
LCLTSVEFRDWPNAKCWNVHFESAGSTGRRNTWSSWQ